MKDRLTKLFTTFLAVVLLVGMSPAAATTAYAASWNSGGKSISNWWNNWFGGSNKNDSASNSGQNGQTGEKDATTNSKSNSVDLDELDGGGSSDGQLSLTKSITHKEGDNYTIRLEAYATGEVKNTTVTKDVPTDIVLVLDQSGSMKEKMITTKYEKVYSLDTSKTYYIKTDSGWKSVSYRYWGALFPIGGKAWRTGPYTSTITPKTNESDTSSNTVQFYTRIVDNSSETRLQALQAAVNSFLTNVKNKANGKEDLYRVAVVGFASGQKYNGTNYNYGNTEVFVGSNQYTYNAGSSNNASNTNSAQSHYKDALQDVGTTTGYDNLIASKNSLSADGGTIANLGMEMAKGILNNSPTDHNKAIVMFTDGQPGWSGFDENIANSTIKESYNSKSKGTSVYTVGVFGGDDLTTDVQTYMSRTSSNYPTAQNMTDELTEESTDYYMTADNAADLNNIFKQISDNIQTGSTSVLLDSNSVLRDVISDDFSLTNGENTNIVVKTADYQGGEFKDASSWKTPESFKDAQVNITGKTINVSNFNYKELYAATINGKNQGKKLIVEIPVTINRSFGANNVLSNASAGIYTAIDATDAFITVESPEGSHPTEYGVKGTEQWIDPDKTVTIKSLIDYAEAKDGFKYTPNGTNNKYVDIVYTITDKDGKEVGTYTIKHGQTEGVASPANTPKLNVDTVYTVTAKVTPISDPTDADKACGRQAETKTYKTESHVYIKGVDKAFVIDFGKPVTYTKDQVFSKNQLVKESKISIKDASNTYGNLTLNNDKSITYKLNKFMDGIDTYVFNVACKAPTQTVKMVPASSVYYEDNFGEETDADGNVTTKSIIDYDDNWTTVKDGNVVTSINGNDPVGYDSAYEGQTKFSSGSARMAKATDGIVKASFTFKGSGIDLYGYTSGNTGKMIIQLYKLDDQGNMPQKVTYSTLVDTKYNSGEVYQTPLFSYMGTENAKYKVVVTVLKGSAIYLDALRVYYPIGTSNENYKKDENNIQYVDIRDQIFNPEYFSVSGKLFVDTHAVGHDTKPAHIIDLSKDDDKAEYSKYGRKREVAIAPGGTVTLSGFKNGISVKQIGMRTNALAPDEFKLKNATGIVDINGEKINLNSATDMYYNVTIKDGKLEITNNTNYIITLTNLKLK